MEYYQTFETSLEAWPFFVNVLFVFEKNVYSVFAGYRVLYICLLHQAYGVQIFHFHDNIFPGFSLSNRVSWVSISHGDCGFVSHYVHFLFTSTCLVYLSCPLTISVLSFFLLSVGLIEYSLFSFICYTCLDVVFSISVLLVLTLKFLTNILDRCQN